MSDKLTVEILGTAELQAAFKALGDRFSAVLAAAVEAGAMLIQNPAKELAPYRVGNLRRSIITEIDEKTAEVVTAKVGPSGTATAYAAAQEFGATIVPKNAKILAWKNAKTGEWTFAHVVNIPAHPYMRPAFDEHKGEAQAEIARVLKGAMSGGGGA